MGSSQALSNGNEPEELTALLAAFEDLNRVGLSIFVTVLSHRGKPDILASVTATDVAPNHTGAKRSASQNAICWGSEYKSLMGLFTSLLYQLDFQLAEKEWEKVKEQR